MTFEEKHAEVDEDPLVELKRRMQSWASAPPSRGKSLHAAIVPYQTIEDAITLLEHHRQIVKAFESAKTKGRA